MNKDIERVKDMLKKVNMSCLETKFEFIVSPDLEYQILLPDNSVKARIFIQVKYISSCNKTGEVMEWKGAKYYLSAHMTEDEVIKTGFKAFKQAIEHEILEGYKVSGKALFNPHTHYKALLSVSDEEVVRIDKRTKV